MIAFIPTVAAALIVLGQSGSAAAQSAGATTPAGPQAEFIARCTRAMVAQNPQAEKWAGDQCKQEWKTVVAAGPMADAILATAPVSGAVDPATLRARLTMIKWDARPQGKLIASGRLGRPLSVQVDRAGPSLNFFWGASGAPIPYDLLGALRGRGAQVAMVGCSMLGVGETSKLYRISVANRAPFALSIYDRMAPTANAGSFYNVGVNLSGRVPTLAQLRRDGSEWKASCSS